MAGQGNQSSDFQRLRAEHESRAAGCRRWALLMAVLGILVVVVSMSGVLGLPPVYLLAPGLLVLALAVIPWREHLEHKDRMTGLEVLEEEYQSTQGQADSAEVQARLLALANKLYA